ncbi:MAG: RluA family pseudouridine synthase [Treponema sp.]|nr:RluA family pseudouridine synthase [Treponema sp.]
MELITGENDAGRRIDRILRKSLRDYPLSLIHKLLRQKNILVNGKPVKAQDRLECGDIITINIKLQTDNTDHKRTVSKTTTVPHILWEGSGLIAVYKPAGLAVHGDNSLDNMVQSYLIDKLPPSLSFKPGPLHRLDKPSSGVVIFSASLQGAKLFTSLLRERKVKKTYLAVVEGIINKDENWQDELVRDHEIKKTFVSKEKSDNSKTAITKIMPVAQEDGYTLIKARIATGRTHQIRAQCAAHNHPLAGDVKYGGKKCKEGFFLHAWKLEFLNYSIEAPVQLAMLNMNPNRFPDGIYKRLSVLMSS